MKNNIISIWSFKINKSPYGRLIKRKACLCAHGGIQQFGVNYWDTYSPVVNWMLVRAMLTLSILHKFRTKLVDLFWPMLRMVLSQKSTCILPWVLELMEPTLESGLSG